MSHNDGQEPWTSSKEMIENVSRLMDDMITIHHSYDPEIIFDSPTKARGIWAMTDAAVSKNGDRDNWTIGYGYYYETYEKRDGRWMFTTRRWHNYFSTSSDGVNFPKDAPKGSNAFDDKLRRHRVMIRVKAAFFSFTPPPPPDDDGSYLRWHLLDHQVEQYQLPGIQYALRYIADGDYPTIASPRPGTSKRSATSSTTSSVTRWSRRTTTSCNSGRASPKWAASPRCDRTCSCACRRCCTGTRLLRR